jgi:phytoene dehydrogenase-like protein
MRQQGDEDEIIILGSGLGGLVAATWLAIQNRNVLLLKESGYDPTYVHEGYRFVPFSNFSERHLKPRTLLKISQVLNLSLYPSDRKREGKVERKRRRFPGKFPFQVVLPKARIDLFHDRSLFRQEWKREFREEVALIEKFYSEIDRLHDLIRKARIKEGFWSDFPVRSRSALRGWFSSEAFPAKRLEEKLSPFSREFKEFIRLQLISWGNLCSDQFPLSLMAYLLLNHEAGEGVPYAEAEKVESSILQKFVQSGGRIAEVEGVEQLAMERKQGFILSLKGDRRPLRSKTLILNAPLHHLSSLSGRKRKLLSKWSEKIQPVYAIVPLLIGIHEKAVPVGMGDLLVSTLDLERSYEGGNLLFIALSPEGDEKEAPMGRRSLVVESLLPFARQDEASWVEHQNGVMRHLNHLFPFLERDIEFCDWNWARKGLSCWSYPHFICGYSPDLQWRKGVVPTRIAKNLYFVGKENFPCLGFEGEILSGWMVAKQILKG